MLHFLDNKQLYVEFEVPGAPEGKGRPRFTQSGHAFTPQKTRLYEAKVRSYALEAMTGLYPADGEIYAEVIAECPIPKSTTKAKAQQMLMNEIRPAKKPDSDNIAKAILDSINGIVYRDDAQVVELYVRKFYGKEPRVTVRIYA